MTARITTIPRLRPEHRRPEALSSAAIYDGRRHIGDVVERPNGYEAALPTGGSLGLFNNATAACHALLLAARQP